MMLSWAFVKPWVTVLPPIFINLILNWTAARQRGEDAKAHVALLYIAGLFCAQMATSLCMSQALIIGRRLCIRAKALVIAEVFTKSLRRKDLAGKALVQGEKDPKDASTSAAEQKAEAEGPASAGRIQNLVSVDASRSEDHNSEQSKHIVLIHSPFSESNASCGSFCIRAFLLPRSSHQ